MSFPSPFNNLANYTKSYGDKEARQAIANSEAVAALQATSTAGQLVTVVNQPADTATGTNQVAQTNQLTTINSQIGASTNVLPPGNTGLLGWLGNIWQFLNTRMPA